jgi:transcriptional regulator with XRE-family HTH domain
VSGAVPDPDSTDRLAAEIRRRRTDRGLGRAELAALVGYSAEYVGRAERPRKGLPSADLVAAVDRVLDAGGALVELRSRASALRGGRQPLPTPDPSAPAGPDGDLLGLAERAEASDVAGASVDAVEEIGELLARSYAGAPPERLLAEVRRRAAEVAALLDRRSTLRQRRRLLVVGGWLALLGATLHVDLGNRAAAAAARAAAAALGRETGHDELVAWSVEIAAWTAAGRGRAARAPRGRVGSAGVVQPVAGGGAGRRPRRRPGRRRGRGAPRAPGVSSARGGPGGRQ